jgi:hypothetical protein
MKPEILQLRNQLIEARSSAESMKSVVDPINAELENEISLLRLRYYEQNAEAFDLYESAQNQLTEADTSLRQALCAAYEQSGEKQIAEGLSVRVNTRLEYDTKKALTWAKEHQLCLTLDKPAFEKIAKVQDLDFVEAVETPTAVIAKDLGAITQPEPHVIAEAA